ncbi:MAG: hypothetical protein JWO37_284 [Acidimicrobiales bacterium]|jgi:hypothetical protein|nr:hypothetical protein [Acidimicrobiales bacterium]
MDAVSLRLQGLPMSDQVMVLSRIAQGRTDTGRFGPSAVDALLDELGLPRPSKVSNVLLALERKHLLTRLKTPGSWRLSPKGLARSNELASDIDLAVLGAEMAAVGGSALGHALHPVIPPSLAPPELVGPLASFLAEHPFDTNVFGMTRFPDEQDDEDPDPVGPALEVASEVCAAHGVDFHLASHRAMSDDLWSNVAAHMWASRYGVAFFEDRRHRGINYNLTIEVGAMLAMGRRCALLKDTSAKKLPTDLVGKIYKTVELDDAETVAAALHRWLRDDLAVGSCAKCPA